MWENWSENDKTQIFFGQKESLTSFETQKKAYKEKTNEKLIITREEMRFGLEILRIENVYQERLNQKNDIHSRINKIQ